MQNLTKIFSAVCLCSALSSGISSAHATETNTGSPLKVTASFGYSPFGVGLGVEGQKDRYIVGASLSSLYVKYDFKPADSGWFVGSYVTLGDLDKDEEDSTYNSILTDITNELSIYRFRRFGVGGGYTWKSDSGFLLVLEVFS